MCVHSMVKIPKGALFTGSKSNKQAASALKATVSKSDRKDVSITVPKAASSALEATVSKAASSPLEAAVSKAAVTSDIKTESSKVG